MKDSVQELIEKDDVITVVNTLFISTDRRDWNTVKACFAEEVLFDMGKPLTRTPRQIVDGWEEGLRQLEAIHHQAGNYQVTLKNREAEVFCYGIAIHYLRNRTGRNTRTFVGSYNFHLVNQNDTWKIDQFKFNLKFIDGNPDLEKQ
jgi:3-phenylpropionate/cinnamic acid dioxygenase small subunit